MAQFSSITYQSFASNPAIEIRSLPAVHETQLSLGRFVVIDGTNIIRLKNAPFGLATLLTLLVHILPQVDDFAVGFDANTRYLFENARRFSDLKAYQYLLDKYREFFSEVTGRTRADDLILPVADAGMGQMISNDCFEDYEEKYPWVAVNKSVMHINFFRGHFYIDHCRLPYSSDLNGLMDKLDDMMRDRFTKPQVN